MKKNRKAGRLITRQRKEEKRVLLLQKQEADRLSKNREKTFDLFSNQVQALSRALQEIFSELVLDEHIRLATAITCVTKEILHYSVVLNCGAVVRCTFSFLHRSDEHFSFSENESGHDIKLVINARLVNYYTLKDRLKQSLDQRIRGLEVERKAVDVLYKFIETSHHPQLISIRPATDYENGIYGWDLLIVWHAEKGEVQWPIDIKSSVRALKRATHKKFMLGIEDGITLLQTDMEELDERPKMFIDKITTLGRELYG